MARGQYLCGYLYNVLVATGVERIFIIIQQRNEYASVIQIIVSVPS
jgi:hypothetical protein